MKSKLRNSLSRKFDRYINKGKWNTALESVNSEQSLIQFFDECHPGFEQLKNAIDQVNQFPNLLKFCLESMFILAKQPDKKNLYYIEQILSTSQFRNLFLKELEIIQLKYKEDDYDDEELNNDEQFFNYFLTFTKNYLENFPQSFDKLETYLIKTQQKIKFICQIASQFEIQLNQVQQFVNNQKLNIPKYGDETNSNYLQQQKINQQKNNLNQQTVIQQYQQRQITDTLNFEFQQVLNTQQPSQIQRSTNIFDQQKIEPNNNDQLNSKVYIAATQFNLQKQEIPQINNNINPHRAQPITRDSNSQIILNRGNEFIRNNNNNIQKQQNQRQINDFNYENDKFTKLFFQQQQLNNEDQIIEGQESFNMCPIEPTIGEFLKPLQNHEVFGGIIFNIPKGNSYKNVKLFLNNHFFILREDYLKEFRKSIFNLKKESFQNVGNDMLKNLFLYSQVMIERILVTNKGFQFVITMCPYEARNRKINWKKSKRLMPGSLIILTTIDFDLMIFGTIIDKQSEEINNRVIISLKIITLKLQQQLEQINLLLSKNKPLVAIENQIYFEAYTHFLSCLKQKNPEEFPFKEQIVFSSCVMPLPGYLQNKGIENQGIIYDIDLSFDLHRRSEKGQNHQINILKEWPKINSESLDDSQIKAIQVILKNGISLIQGPPGTGKTFCGALGIKILLSNIYKWKPNYYRQNNPILIVCQTNHALDQFLKHILTFCNEEQIVRIGGRCKEEKFEQMLLQNQYHEPLRFQWSEFHYIRDNLDRKIRNLLNLVDNVHYRDVKIHESHLVDLIVNQYLDTEDMIFENQLDEESEKLLVHMWLDTYKPGEEQAIKIKEIEKRVQNKLINAQEKKKKFRAMLKLPIRELEQDIELSKEAIQKLMGNEDDGADENEFIDSDEEENRIMYNKDNGEKENTYIQKLIEDKKTMRRLLNRINCENEESYQQILIRLKDPNYRIWEMLQSERNIFSKQIFKKKYEYLYSSIKQQLDVYDQLIEELQNAYIKRDMQCMKQKQIIGVTLAGCAKYAEKLSNLKCNIMVVEEAGEVLESNLVSVLSKNINHLILIGDHQQLKPSLNCYQLERKYEANISLFERLVKNGLEYVTLNYQRRMKTQFADFIRLIYPDYKDHSSISIQNNIKIQGMASDLVFFTHKETENLDKFSSSKSNQFEAQMAIKLVDHLIKNGTSQENITILTTYGKQALYIQKQINKKVRIQTIDNYQGEENDIIILSLVRSNYNGKLGFVAIDNRICVALSRARLGLYILGNFLFIENCIQYELKKDISQRQRDVTDLWLKIIKLAKQKNVFLDHIPLECGSHNEITKIRNINDWQLVKNGGCTIICNTKFPCGHICKDRCHIYDHSQENCYEQCQQILQCNHVCLSKCKNIPCPPCRQLINVILPNCGHKTQIQCSQNISKVLCNERCTKLVSCGHQCSLLCKDDCNRNFCSELLKEKLDCGHTIEIRCQDKKYAYKLICTAPCNKPLPCGHQCQGTCGTCLDKFHQPCHEKCQKHLSCGHQCQLLCGLICYQCTNNCNVICNCNIQCSNKCYILCRECKNDCKIGCEHTKCTKKCYEECDRQQCNQLCQKKLDCGCQCLGLCGEICPKICQDSLHKSKQQELSDSNGPYYQLECQNQCIIEVNILDQFFNSVSLQQLIKCPQCKSDIYTSRRYQRYVKMSLLNFNKLKQIKFDEYQVDEEKLDLINEIVERQLIYIKSQNLKDSNGFLDSIKQDINHNIQFIKVRQRTKISYQKYLCIKFQLQQYKQSIELQKLLINNTQFQQHQYILLNYYLLSDEFRDFYSEAMQWKIEQKLKTLLLYGKCIRIIQSKKNNLIQQRSFEIEDSSFFLSEMKINEIMDDIQQLQII